MLTDEEAFAMTLGLRALRQLGLSAFAPATEGAVAKLGRVLPEPMRESVRTVEDVVALEVSPWTVTTSADALIRAAAAIRARRCVTFDYTAHSGNRSQRELEPYGVVHADGRWYLVGRCLLRDALRTFRLDRVSNLVQTEKAFERPAGFDVAAYLHEAMPFVMSTYKIDVWLELPIAEARKWLCPWRVVAHEENGGTVLNCGRDDLPQFAAMLLSFGCRVVVRNPPELRQAFAELAQRASDAANSLQSNARTREANANDVCRSMSSV
jgi:predicted DNA-binding transcriptional regulator YafY